MAAFFRLFDRSIVMMLNLIGHNLVPILYLRRHAGLSGMGDFRNFFHDF